MPRLLTIAIVANTFADMLRRRAKHTRRAYVGDAEAYQAWSRAESVPHALFDLLKLGFVGARKNAESYELFLSKRFAKNTVKRRVGTLKTFVAAARRDGLVEWKLETKAANLLTREEKKATARRDMAGPTKEKFKVVMEYLQAAQHREGAVAIRDTAILGLLENPMLRRAEVSALDVEDIKLTSGMERVTIVGKGRDEPEKLPLPPGVADSLRAWLHLRNGKGNEPVFVRIHKSGAISKARLGDHSIYLMTIKRGKQALGPRSKRLNPHALRHAGITKLAALCAEKGIPTTEGMEVSRHKKSETFERYIDRKGQRSRELVRAIEESTDDARPLIRNDRKTS